MRRLARKLSAVHETVKKRYNWWENNFYQNKSFFVPKHLANLLSKKKAERTKG